ncbi:MAG: indole-3-glycerol-phosphate synthase [Candidatus Altiarchaeales archaeon]|nr:indole-3-glycerol-phosphate synthase [Candidatus Altiarchaeales archaeon]
MSALKPVVENTLKVVESRKRDRDYCREVERRLRQAGKSRMLSKVQNGNSIIAEAKFASPSEGFISDCRLENVVNDYVKGGAAALSILTEEKYFKGSLGYIEQARKIARIPILRKDFILDEFQLKEARAFGADGVLLIACLLENKLGEFIGNVKSYGLWALVETHSEKEVENALDSGARVIGINNRNLSTLKLELGTTRAGISPHLGVSSRSAGFKPPDLNTTIRLCHLIPKNKIFVTESGINTPKDIKKLKQECERKPDYYLIGTSLMKAVNIKEKLKQLVNA